MSSILTPAPTAIIAEDEDLGRLLLAQSASAAGLAPLVFDNGENALDAALTQPVSIVLLDVDMPGMDGYTVCRRIRDSGRLASVPIVMVTGHDDTAAINRAFEAGATDYISKPVNWALLPHRLAYILRNAAAARHVEQLAYFDPLTALPNRQRCIEVAQRLLADVVDTQDGIGIIYLDLNSFKKVNDTFGHSVGDLVLKQVAQTLSKALANYLPMNPHLSLARLGGDEFVILVRNSDARAMALEVAGACCSALSEPIECGQLEFFTTPSIGISVYPEDGTDVETLLKHADTAMYHAKSSGAATIAAYTASMSARLRDWLELESRLRRAVRENLLSLRFQPKIRLEDNSLAGVEALTRWCDAEHGEISPTRFIPIAEETGLIVDMGIWIIRAVCRQLRDWIERGIAVPVAINISGKELLYGDPAKIIAAEIARLRIPASLIEIEITESVFVTDSITGQTTIERLRALGCRIALDDFGTGYSSLAYLARFPPDRIKIDRSFVQNVDNSEVDAAIVNAIMTLSQTLHLTVTAEGVERQSQIDWLRARGCDEAQGYLLGRPLSAAELESQFLHGLTDDARKEDTLPIDQKQPA